MFISEANKRRKRKVASSVTYTTGDPMLNLMHFNKMMGTDDETAEKAAEKINTELADATADSTAGAGEAGMEASSSEGASMGESMLTEAKRKVKRYYIRPQNIYCGNKTDILKALIELGTQNCSIYTLNNLENNEDVHKLTNKDIIYYYDDGILYDKNHVKVMDYDLYIKHEENRDKIDPEQVSDEKFTDVYDDRMTDATVAESLLTESSVILKSAEFKLNGENVKLELKGEGNKYIIGLYYDQGNGLYRKDWEATTTDKAKAIRHFDAKIKDYEAGAHNSITVDTFFTESENYDFYETDTIDNSGEYEDEENPFSLYFESINAYGEKVSKKLKESDDNICCICGEEIEGYGNNPAPYKNEGRCCDACNVKFVIPARLEQWNK